MVSFKVLFIALTPDNKFRNFWIILVAVAMIAVVKDTLFLCLHTVSL